MRATQVGKFGSWLASTAVSEDRLWQRELDQISPLEIQTFYARASQAGQRSVAIEAIDRLQTALITAAIEGHCTQADLRIVGHEIPSDPYCVDDFIDGLLNLRPARRAAVLYALECVIEPEQVEELSWYKVKTLTQLKPNAQEILKAQAKTRHLRLPYVFWEWKTPDIAAPVLGLRSDAAMAFDQTWPALQASFTDMLWVSGRADAASFLGLAEEIRAGRL